jgi:16S rRNA (guanine527-N7)-methyltransferase
MKSNDLKQLLTKHNLVPDNLLTAKRLSLLNKYISLVYKYNEKYSLTGVDEGEFPRLVAESLIPIEEIQGETLLDVGSGGGLPAIPLKLFREGMNFTLIEPSDKKWFSLREIIHQLNLSGIEVLKEQLETHIKRNLNYDNITIRGIAPDFDFFNKIKLMTANNSKIIYYRENIDINIIKHLENSSFNIYNINSIENLRGVTIFIKMER